MVSRVVVSDLDGMFYTTELRVGIFVTPNVRAKLAPTVGRQARTGENVPRTARPGPGGLPLVLRLSEGLGVTGQPRRGDLNGEHGTRLIFELPHIRYSGRGWQKPRRSGKGAFLQRFQCECVQRFVTDAFPTASYDCDSCDLALCADFKFQCRGSRRFGSTSLSRVGWLCAATCGGDGNRATFCGSRSGTASEKKQGRDGGEPGFSERSGWHVLHDRASSGNFCDA